MASKTPSNQGGSGTGISDVKYQKAIKQISKLITLNTSIKNQNTKLQQKYDKLQNEYDLLQQKYNNLQIQYQRLKNNNGETIQTLGKLPFIQTKQSRILKGDQKSQQLAIFIQNKKKIQQLEERLFDKEDKMIKLKHQVQQKNKEIQELLIKNQNLQQQTTYIRKKLQKNQQKLHQKQNIKLKNQLQRSQQLIKKISLDYQLLKKQHNFNQKQSINSIQLSGSYSSNIKDPLSFYYLDKLRKVEAQNIKIKKQFIDQKKKFKVQIDRMKNQKQFQFKKLLNLASFAEKQHSFIQKILITQKSQNIMQGA